MAWKRSGSKHRPDAQGPDGSAPEPCGQRWARRVRSMVAGLAAGLLALEVLSEAGLIDWRLLGRLAVPPWNQLLNPGLTPKTARLLAGLGVWYLVVWGLAAFLERPRVRGLLGSGTATTFRRLLAFVWLPVAAALYLVVRADPALLRAQLALRGSQVVLTLPTLVGIVVFGLAAVSLAYRPGRRYLGGLGELAATAALLMVLASVLLSLDRLVDPRHRPWDTPLGSILSVQLGLIGVEASYLLAALEALRADLGDFRAAARRGWAPAVTTAARGLALARGMGRLAVAFGPVLVGTWLAIGASLPAASPILDRDGVLLQYYHRSGVFRLPAAAADIPQSLYLAVEAIEDPGLQTASLSHAPLSPIRLVGIFEGATRAANGEGEGALSGGSGIAAQACKNFSGRPLVDLARDVTGWAPARWLLAGGATVVEKLAFEYPCGWAFERVALWLPADRSPLTFYENQVYFGQGAYGVRAAALTYFGKDVRDVTPAEAILLAGLPQAPSYYDPWLRPDAVRQRRREVLDAMVRQGYLSSADAAAIDAQPLGVLPEPDRPDDRANAFVEQYVMPWLEAHGVRDLSTAGRVVRTTLDWRTQQALERDAAATVQSLARRRVDDAGAVALDPRTGEVLGWYGGAKPGAVLDTAVAYPHQPGSTIKPALYACALERGVLKPDELLDDTQRVIGGEYVANWDYTSRGRRPAAEELSQSRNTAAAELVRRLTPEGFAECLRDTFQVRTDLHAERHGVELGLGTAEMPTLELATTYTILASGGVYREPTPVLSVQDGRGRELYHFEPGPGRRVLSCSTAAWVAKALGEVSADLHLPGGLATKTGTTSSSSYAVGYGSDVVVAAWVGRSDAAGTLLALDDVYGEEGGAVIWRGLATSRYGGDPPPAFTAFSGTRCSDEYAAR